MKLRQVSSPNETTSYDIKQISDIKKAIHDFDNWILFREFKNGMEAVVVDGYISHKKFNNYEVDNLKNMISNLQSENRYLKSEIKEINYDYETIIEDYQMMLTKLHSEKKSLLKRETKNTQPKPMQPMQHLHQTWS